MLQRCAPSTTPLRLISWPFLVVLLAVLLAGCYQAAPGATANDDPSGVVVHVSNPRPAKTVIVGGSAIVGSAMNVLAINFNNFMPGYSAQIGSSGTTSGFKLLCEDKVDVEDAVRPMNTDEMALCLHNGIEYVQFAIAFDTLAVVGDAPIGGCISSSELAYVYTHDTTTWAAIRSGLPAVPVNAYAPPANTAAAQFFSERVLNGKASKPVPDIRQLVFGGGGIGYMALGDARKLDGRQPILSVDSGGGCTAPTEDSIRDGSYSYLSRPLYLYINRQSLRRSEVFRFVGYVLSKPGQEQIAEAGFVPATPKAFQEMQNQVDSINQER